MNLNSLLIQTLRKLNLKKKFLFPILIPNWDVGGNQAGSFWEGWSTPDGIFEVKFSPTPGLELGFPRQKFPPRFLITFTRLKKIRRHLDSNPDRSRRTSSTRLKSCLLHLEGRKWRRSAKQNITAHRCEHLLWNAHQPRSLGQHGGVKPLAATAKPLKGDALTSVAVSAAEFRSEILSSRLSYRRNFSPPEDSSSTYRFCKSGRRPVSNRIPTLET